MHTIKRTILPLTAAALFSCFTLPLAAAAQTSEPAQLPAYATPGGETVRGTITSIDGKYTISVRDDRGFVDNVTLHAGTVIQPTGIQLAAGQSVTIAGIAAGGTFIANEIDTPYVALAVPYGYYDDGFYPFDRVAFGFGRSRFGFRGRF
jgi:hypothetical protein